MRAVLAFQLLGLLVVAIVCWAALSYVTALSFLFGGLTGWAPNVLFAMRLSGARSEHLPIVWISGQVVKLGLATLALVALGKLWPGAAWPAVVSGLGAFALLWMVSLAVTERSSRRLSNEQIDRLVREMSSDQTNRG